MTKLRVAFAAAGLLALAAMAAAQARGHHGWAGFAARHDSDGDGAVTREELEGSDHFARLDRDGDGRIVEAEVEAMGQRMVVAHLARWADADDDRSVTAAEWAAFVAARDEDGDGELDLRARHHRSGPAGEEGAGPLDVDGDGAVETADLQALFAQADSDGDGTLEASELPAPPMPFEHFRGGGPGHGGFGPEGLLARLDGDGDGKVSRAEWDAFEPPHFAPEHRAEIFGRLDGNGDGSLSAEELAAPHLRHPRR